MTNAAEAAPEGASPEASLEPISVRIPEACRLTGIGRSKLYELIASGELEVVKIGAMTLVPFKNLRALVEERGCCEQTNPNQEK